MSNFNFKYFGDGEGLKALLEFEGELDNTHIITCIISLVDNKAFLSLANEEDGYVDDVDTSELSKEDLDHIIQTLKDIREGME